jgi:hypothetical protein
MFRNKAIAFLLVMILVSGCKLFGPSLKPTVDVLRKTIKAMREDDYEKGRVIYSSKADLNSRLLEAKIERLKQAENNAAVALKERVPHPELQKAKK